MAPRPAETTGAAFLVAENKRSLHGTRSWIFAAYTVNIGTSSFPLQPSCPPSGRHFHVTSSPFHKGNAISEEHAHPSFPHISHLPSLSVGSPWKWSARKMWTSMSSELPTNSNVIWPIFCKVSTVSPLSSRSSLHKKKASYMKVSMGRTKMQSLALLTHSKPWNQGEPKVKALIVQQSRVLTCTKQQSYNTTVQPGQVGLCVISGSWGWQENSLLEGEDSGELIIWYNLVLVTLNLLCGKGGVGKWSHETVAWCGFRTPRHT